MRRRLLLALGGVVLVGLVGLLLVPRGATGTAVMQSEATAAPVCTQLPSSACRSPDGAWSVTTIGKGVAWVTHHGSGGMPIFPSDVAGADLVWAKPHTLFFDDNYRLFRLDPVAGKRTIIADWSDFVVSPDGRWIAGYAYVGGSAAPALTIGVLSIDGKTCLAVPHGSHESDSPVGFTKDGQSVVVARNPYDAGNGLTGGPSHLLAYAISSLPASKEC